MNTPSNQRASVDESYYRHTGKMGFARRVSTVARRRVHELFLKTMQPRPLDRILDIGASDDTGLEANMLEQLYPPGKN